MRYLLVIKIMLLATVAVAQQKQIRKPATKPINKAIQKPAQKQEDVGGVNFTAQYDGGDVALNYNPVVDIKTDSIIVNVVRKGLDGEEVIRANRSIAVANVYKFTDTTTREKPGVYQYQLTATAANRVVASASVWAYAYPPDAKPVVAKFNITNLTGSNNNVLKWKMQNGYAVKTLQLKRSRSKDGKYQTIADLSPQDTLIDKVHDAKEPFYYRLDMTVYNDGNVYQSVSPFVIPDFVIIPKPVVGIKAEQKNEAIYVTWQNNDEFARGYYVKKRAGNAGDFLPTTSIILKNKTGNYLWKDTLSSLQPKEMYQYVLVAESNSFNQSNHSDTVTVSFQSTVKVLSPPNDLRILTANDTTYNLVWTVDSLHKDEVAAYQLYYKSKTASAFSAVKDALVPAQINFIGIPKPKDGDAYYVKAVNGAAQSAPSMTYTYSNAFQKEFGPKYLKAAVINGLLNIKWLKDEDVQFKAFKLYRWNGKTFVMLEQISPEKDIVATKTYIPGALNIYKLTTINLQGEESKGSKVLQVN